MLSASWYPGGTTIEVGQISISSSTACPGCSGHSSSWVCQGRYGNDFLASSLRCEARSHPSPIGTRGSFEPMKVVSFPFGSNKRKDKNTSASAVGDDSHNFAATGPVISMLLGIGGVRKVKPSPLVS